MAAGGRHRRPDDEAGQSSAEYMGALALVAAIVVGLIGSGVASSIAAGLQQAVCSVTAEACGGRSAGPARPG